MTSLYVVLPVVIFRSEECAEAAELCKVYSFDCILMDIEMPVMNRILKG
jgi:CheY-like chemotaxis protein